MSSLRALPQLNVIKLQLLGGKLGGISFPNKLFSNKFKPEAIKIPPRYTKPFISLLNIDPAIKKNPNNKGDKAANNLNPF